MSIRKDAAALRADIATLELTDHVGVTLDRDWVGRQRRVLDFLDAATAQLKESHECLASQQCPGCHEVIEDLLTRYDKASR